MAYPKVKEIELGVIRKRQTTSRASCSHLIEKGEKYYAIRYAYYGRPSQTTYCLKCAIKELKKTINQALNDVQSLLS